MSTAYACVCVCVCVCEYMCVCVWAYICVYISMCLLGVQFTALLLSHRIIAFNGNMTKYVLGKRKEFVYFAQSSACLTTHTLHTHYTHTTHTLHTHCTHTTHTLHTHYTHTTHTLHTNTQPTNRDRHTYTPVSSHANGHMGEEGVCIQPSSG